MARSSDSQAWLRARGVYAIIDPEACRGRDPLWVAERALGGGCCALQLRAKRADRSQLEAWGKALLGLCQAASVPFIVNDSAELAHALGADGLHLGQTDLPLADARALLGHEIGIGISTHTPEQARCAQALGADLIGFGPVFPTSSKPDAEAVVGLAGLRAVRAAVGLPIVAIGGITTEHAAAVAASGADMAAAIGAICGADDPQLAVRALDAAFRL